MLLKNIFSRVMWSVFCCSCFCFDMSSNKNLFLWEPSHTDAEKGPTIERPKRLFMSCVKSPQHLPRGLITALGEEAKGKGTDTSLPQSLICLTPSRALVHCGERECVSLCQSNRSHDHLTSLLFLFTPSRERKGGGFLSIGRQWIHCMFHTYHVNISTVT